MNADEAIRRIHRICEGDANGDRGYTGNELAEVILEITTPIVGPLANLSTEDLQEELRRRQGTQ